MNAPDFNLTKAFDWDKLYREQAPVLKGVCRRYVGDDNLAEDLVQEAFVIALNKVASFRNHGAIEGWIRKIAINNALQYLRNKPATVPIETLSTPIEQELAMEYSNNKIRFAIEKASFSTRELLEVIDHLPVHHRTVFNLYVVDGFSHKQIAQALSISPGTSKSHLARARKKAQELLYAKASEQPNASPRRRYLPFFLFFTPNYIDRIFKKGFLHYQLPAGPPAMLLPETSVMGLKWGVSFVAKVLLGGAALSAGIFAYRAIKEPHPASGTQSTPLPLSILADSVAGDKPDTLLEKNEAASFDPEPRLFRADSAASETQLQPSKEPVVIRKTIVIHDTIYLEKPAKD